MTAWIPFQRLSANDYNFINRNLEDHGQGNQIVNGRQTVSVLPLVNSLRGCETEQLLQLLDGDAGSFPENTDILPGFTQINNWNPHKGTSLPS